MSIADVSGPALLQCYVEFWKDEVVRATLTDEQKCARANLFKKENQRLVHEAEGCQDEKSGAFRLGVWRR